jgi:hypothetical protein
MPNRFPIKIEQVTRMDGMDRIGIRENLEFGFQSIPSILSILVGFLSLSPDSSPSNAAKITHYVGNFHPLRD